MSIPNQLMTIIALWLYFAISCGIWKVSWLFLAIHHIFHLTSHLNSDNCLERLWAIIILYLYMYDRVWDLPGVFYILNVDLQWDSTSSVSCNCLSSVKDKDVNFGCWHYIWQWYWKEVRVWAECFSEILNGSAWDIG